jgi:chloramphenicol O-acetyltransferase type A
MIKADYDSWKRKDIYEFFKPLSFPFYMVSFRQDVSDLYAYVKREGLPFYASMIWACDEAINSIEDFRYAMKDGELVLYERRDPSFTDMKKGSDLFHIVTLDHIDEICDFCHAARKKSLEQDAFIEMEKETEDLIYYSCLPWLDLTALSNERDLSSERSLDDSIPRIAWGKIIEENGRKKVTISVEVNHRFIDGYHIGLFSKKLDEIFGKLDTVQL